MPFKTGSVKYSPGGLEDIFLYPLVAFFAAVLGFLLDYLVFSGIEPYGLAMRILGGAAVAFSAWLMTERRPWQAVIFFLALPGIWVFAEYLGSISIAPALKILQQYADHDAFSRIRSNFHLLYPFVMLVLAGFWLALGLMAASSSIRGEWKKLTIFGLVGGVSSIIISALAAIIMQKFLAFSLHLLVAAGMLDPHRAFYSKFWNAVQLGNNAFLAGIQMYCLNFFLIIPLRTIREKEITTLKI